MHGNGIRIAIAPNNVKKKKRKPRNSIASWEGGDKYDLIVFKMFDKLKAHVFIKEFLSKPVIFDKTSRYLTNLVVFENKK